MSDAERIEIRDVTGKPVAKKGRPRVRSDRPMTSAERNRRSRAKRRAQRQAAAAMPSDDLEKNAQEALAALCASRSIHNRFDQLMAVRVINCLADGRIAEAIKLLDALPQPVRAKRVAGTTVSAQDARDRLWELYCHAVAADRTEEKIAEERESTRLRAEVAALRAQIGQPVAVDRAAVVAVSGTDTRPSPIDVPTSAITPPSERCDLPQNQRMGVYPDDAKVQAKRNAPVLDATPVAGDPTKEGEWDRSANGPAWAEYRRTHGDADDFLY
jgi:hypothetical protein